MINRIFIVFLAALLLTAGFSAGAAQAEPPSLRPHGLFQSNMVLQRDKPIAVWGWAVPGKTVTVSFGGQEQATSAKQDGSWKVSLPAMSASAQPRVMTIACGESKRTYENIVVGDIWVLGGQSNMEQPISNVENGALEIASANFPLIRIASVPQRAGTEYPKDWEPTDHDKATSHGNCRGVWHECSPQTVPSLSAIGYVFVRRIHMATQIPIGVIDASRWGTTVEAWTPQPVLRKIDSPQVRDMLSKWDAKAERYDPQEALVQRVADYNARTERYRKQGRDVSGRTPPTTPPDPPTKEFNYPGNCYAGMIAPLEGFAVKGAIFHQGFNNCGGGTDGALMYQHVFPEMINAWRKAFGDDEMAFGILSLCTDAQPQTRENFTESMANLGQYIREAQYRTYLQFVDAGDRNVGFVSTYDLRRAWYHPWLKIPAGERAARWALATQYDKGRIRWQPARLVEMNAEPGRIVLRFDGPIKGTGSGHPLEGFAVAGEDRKFHPAEVTRRVTGQDSRGRDQFNANVIVLNSPMVARPVHYRYAWARNPMGNARCGGNSDIPLPTQRSDDWPIENTPLGIFGDDPPDQLSRPQWGQLRTALQQEDMRRRVAEAQALLQQQDAAGRPAP